VPSLLVTNDFPPKLGGIQSYLYELWRRLPPEEITVLTTPYDGTREWDAQQAFRIVRTKQKVLLPTRALTRDVDALAREVRADVIFLDPMLPLGLIGPKLSAAPYVVVTHGAEITVPRKLPGTHQLGRRGMRTAAAGVAAGEYPARQSSAIAGTNLRGVVIPPGVDVERFHPIDDDERAKQRAKFGLDPERPLVLGVSRLVPRKGFDIVIDACAQLPNVQLAIAGGGRDRKRLEKRAAGRANVTFRGRVPDDDRPGLYASADVFAMCCRERWAGLEAEGFGIVFMEAAACAVPSIAGRSGGSHEAVVDGETGVVVPPRDVSAVRAAIERFVADEGLRRAMGEAARRRAVEELAYDRLIARLAPVAAGTLADLPSLPR
jgi:phosphatidylinositol alpha-1,6-mannosyltransferase